MHIEVTKPEATFLLEAIAQKPVQTTVGDVVKGIKVDEGMASLINKLQEVVNEKPQDSETPAAEAEKAVEAEVVA